MIGPFQDIVAVLAAPDGCLGLKHLLHGECDDVSQPGCQTAQLSALWTITQLLPRQLWAWLQGCAKAH